MLTNPFIIGAIACIVVILAYLINARMSDEETNNNSLVKLGLLGFSVGLMSWFLMVYASETNVKIDQDIITGLPDF